MVRYWHIPLLVMLLLMPPAWAEVVVIIRREAEPTGKYIRICDVARVDGPQPAAREVAETVLGPAPSRGEVLEFSRWDMQSRLYEMGVGAAVAFSGNDLVLVYGEGAERRGLRESADGFRTLGPVYVADRGGLASGGILGMAGGEGHAGGLAGPIKPEAGKFHSGRFGGERGKLAYESEHRVGQAIADYLSLRYRRGHSKRDDLEVEAKVQKANADIPPDAFEIRVEQELGGKVPGRAELRLAVRDQADAKPRFVEVVADTELFAQGLVANRKVTKGESLDQKDVKVAKVKMEFGKGYLPPKPEAVLGREAKKQLLPGEALTADDTPLGEAVKRGALVVVKTEGKGWEILSQAKAHGGGGIGDIITVEDTSNKKKFTARIVDRGVVAVVVKKN